MFFNLKVFFDSFSFVPTMPNGYIGLRVVGSGSGKSLLTELIFYDLMSPPSVITAYVF